MQSTLHFVQLQLNHLTKLGLNAGWGINGVTYKDESTTTVNVNNRDIYRYIVLTDIYKE